MVCVLQIGVCFMVHLGGPEAEGCGFDISFLFVHQQQSFVFYQTQIFPRGHMSQSEWLTPTDVTPTPPKHTHKRTLHYRLHLHYTYSCPQPLRRSEGHSADQLGAGYSSHQQGATENSKALIWGYVWPCDGVEEWRCGGVEEWRWVVSPGPEAAGELALICVYVCVSVRALTPPWASPASTASERDWPQLRPHSAPSWGFRADKKPWDSVRQRDFVRLCVRYLMTALWSSLTSSARLRVPLTGLWDTRPCDREGDAGRLLQSGNLQINREREGEDTR